MNTCFWLRRSEKKEPKTRTIIIKHRPQAVVKTGKRSMKKVRAAIRRQLSYVKRDIKHLEGFMSEGYAPTAKEIPQLITIYKLFDQQEYMYKNKIHSVPDRIVSISQPWLRPIVRGKVNTPVAFGAKFDVSLDEEGYGRIEKISFDAYNESTILQEAAERYNRAYRQVFRAVTCGSNIPNPGEP